MSSAARFSERLGARPRRSGRAHSPATRGNRVNSGNIVGTTLAGLEARLTGVHRRFVGTAALVGAVLAACDTTVVDAGRTPPLGIVETDAVISTRAELEERALGLSSCELVPSEAHSAQHEFFGVRVYLPPSYEQIILEPAENPSAMVDVAGI